MKSIFVFSSLKKNTDFMIIKIKKKIKKLKEKINQNL